MQVFAPICLEAIALYLRSNQLDNLEGRCGGKHDLGINSQKYRCYGKVTCKNLFRSAQNTVTRTYEEPIEFDVALTPACSEFLMIFHL